LMNRIELRNRLEFSVPTESLKSVGYFGAVSVSELHKVEMERIWRLLAEA
jgi:hypothetical protein